MKILHRQELVIVHKARSNSTFRAAACLASCKIWPQKGRGNMVAEVTLLDLTKNNCLEQPGFALPK